MGRNSEFYELGFWGCFFISIFLLMMLTLSAWVTMLLWNWLAPIFWTDAPILTIWQTFGIIFLLSIIGNVLFKRNSN